MQTKPFPSIQKAFDNIIDPKEVAFGKRKIFVDSILSNIEDGAVQLDKEENLSYLFVAHKMKSVAAMSQDFYPTSIFKQPIARLPIL